MENQGTSIPTSNLALGGKLAKWAMAKIMEASFAGAVLVSKEQYDARLEICEGCPHKGKVEPLPKMLMDGCTLCGCPFATKPKYFSIPRAADKEGTPLSFEEIIALKISAKDKTHEVITCPHPDGNKWADVDSTFSHT